MLLRLPTIMWHPSATDRWLRAHTQIGMVCGALLLVGIGPPILLFAACTLLYLSVQVSCATFLSFQWDSLLVETGVLCVLAAPATLSLSLLPPSACATSSAAPSGLAMWAVRVLLFKLMFSSGVVKFASHCPHWALRSLTAMHYHHWTQPLPHVLAYRLAKLPDAVHKASVLANHAIECLVPVLLFVPLAGAKLVALAAFAALQFGILASGNYGFFNYLTLVLCLAGLDDTLLPVAGCAPALELAAGASAGPTGAGPAASALGAWLAHAMRQLACVCLIALSSYNTFKAFRRETDTLPRAVGWAVRVCGAVQAAVGPLRLNNSYGLFARMTTSRAEVFLEGSADGGASWRRYRLPYQADESAAPRFAGLHMPRLDWRMWFVFPQRGGAQLPDWLEAVGRSLLADNDARTNPVLGLFAHNPFAGGAGPSAIRIVWAFFEFTDDLRTDGCYWRVRAPAQAAPGERYAVLCTMRA